MKNIYDTAPMADGFRLRMLQWSDRLWAGKAPIHVARTQVLHQAVSGMRFHNHLELFLQQGGCNQFALPDATFDLQAGEVALVPAGVPHRERAEDREKPFDMLVLMAGLEWTTFIRADRGPDGTPRGRQVLSIPAPDFAAVDAAVACASRFLEAPGDAKVGSGILAALLGGFARALEQARFQEGVPDDLVGRCHALVQNDFSSPDCNVARLATELGCSPNYLSACYRQATGERLSTVIMRLRVERAAFLLKNSRDRVTDIALASGFTDSSYFISRFRSVHGLSPLAYRRTHGSAADSPG